MCVCVSGGLSKNKLCLWSQRVPEQWKGRGGCEVGVAAEKVNLTLMRVLIRFEFQWSNSKPPWPPVCLPSSEPGHPHNTAKKKNFYKMCSSQASHKQLNFKFKLNVQLSLGFNNFQKNYKEKSKDLEMRQKCLSLFTKRMPHEQRFMHFLLKWKFFRIKSLFYMSAALFCLVNSSKFLKQAHFLMETGLNKPHWQILSQLVDWCYSILSVLTVNSRQKWLVRRKYVLQW